MYFPLIRNIVRFIILVIMQVMVFDNIRFGNFIHPYVYVLFIMLLPFDTPKAKLIFNGFLIGIVIDLLSGTPGLNAAATVFMAFIRPFVINTITRKSDIEDKNAPTVTEMGLEWFLLYALILLLLHNLFLFWLEAFSIRLLGVVLLETILSTPISLIVILLIIYIFKPNKK